MSAFAMAGHRFKIFFAITSFAALPYYSVRAQTTVSTAQTTPVATSSAGDVTINSGSSITVSATNAVTIDSNNSITNSGSITVNDGNQTTGILTTGGIGGALGINNAGAITITDSTLATAIPLAGGVNRYGIQINSPSLFSGTITNGSSASITIRGDNSAGIYINQGGVGGTIVNAGTIGVTGNNTFGILTNANTLITGAISITNAVAAVGVGSGALQLNGSLGGQLYIDSIVRADGYFSSGAVISARPASFTGLGPNDFLQSGPAVSVLNNINFGVGPSYNYAGGIFVDTAGDVASFGAAPALQIGAAAGGSAEIGVGTGSSGLVISGTVEANGLYDGFGSSAIQIGGVGGTATIDGGITNAGKILSTAYSANAIGISLLSGASVPSIVNSGTIAANVNFGAGANAAVGGNATAILDNGGALASITNTGIISATTASGNAIALDLRGDTTAVTFNQNASGTTTPSSIAGSLLFGPVGATLNLNSGTLANAIVFGAGTNNNLNINNGAILAGPVTETPGGTVALNIANGRLQSTSPSALVLSSLKIGSTGEIDYTVGSTTATAGGLNVVGAIIIANGAKVGLDIGSPLTAPQTFTVVQTAGSTGALIGQPALLLGEVPYFYAANIATNTATGTIALNISDRSFSQSGVLGSASAYNAVFASSYNDTGIRDAFNAASTQQNFKHLYQQMLPSYSGGLFESLAQGSNAVVRAQAGNPVVENNNRGGAWAQQIGFGEQNSTNSAPGYHGGGIGFAFGWETPASPISTWGVSVSYMRSAVRDYDTGPKDQEVGTVYSGGVYWREVDGAFRTDASLNAGVAEMNSERNFAGADLLGNAVSRTADAAWTGGLAQGHLGVSYEQPIGDFYVKPLISGDYFVLYQGSRNEHNGGAGFNLDIASNAGKQGSVVGGLTFGTQFGSDFFTWRPEVMVGYKQVFGGADNISAQFAGGSSFSISPTSQQGGAIAHLGIHGGNKYSDFAFEAGGEDRGEYHNFDGRVVARFRF